MSDIKSDYGLVTVEEIKGKKEYYVAIDLAKLHYDDLSFNDFINFVIKEFASLGIEHDRNDVIGIVDAFGMIEKCPKCNAQSEGTTYLCEIDKTVHQCKNGHMWEESPI